MSDTHFILEIFKYIQCSVKVLHDEITNDKILEVKQILKLLYLIQYFESNLKPVVLFWKLKLTLMVIRF